MRLVLGFFISTLCLRAVLIVAGQDLPAREALMAGVPPLTAAVIRQDLPRLQRLLDAGEDPTQKDDQSFTPWMWAIAAVVRQRLASVGEPLRALSGNGAWLGNHQTAEAVFDGMSSGVKNTASWLPDETTARGWQAVIGAAK